MLDNLNCKELLKTTHNHIKALQQTLENMLPTDDSHTLIKVGESRRIEVIPHNLVTFKIPCKNANSPAKFMLSLIPEKDDKLTPI